MQSSPSRDTNNSPCQFQHPSLKHHVPASDLSCLSPKSSIVTIRAQDRPAPGPLCTQQKQQQREVPRCKTQVRSGR
ncbi:hypothetical protein GQ43DRAFT_444668 [Delitschia confertaspora ATCC 74209]|uniref:Uncharacterized protein n=1 Tax=Delitschia confertaspora ATCC 74209 TaxID=1513339 RepID=A0A9P4JER5_9PLEO|nr:hypothetical protein GQ43DRAFT_444668 [Delitschia confertaspora ATCC 74209]